MPSDRDDTPKPTGPNGQSPTSVAQTSGVTPAPFARRAVQWGRPPQTTFHAGPLPRGNSFPPMPASMTPRQTITPPAPVPAPQPRAQANIFSGSMIPQARPATPSPTSLPGQEPRPGSRAEPDLTVRPLPAVQPTIERIAPLPPIPEPEPAAEPIPPMPQAPLAAAQLRPVEPAVAPIVAPISTSGRPSRAKTSRTPLYVGIVAVAVIAIAATVWFTSRDGSTVAPAEPVTTAPPVPSQPPLDATPLTAPTLEVPQSTANTPTPAPAATAEPQPTAPTTRATPSAETPTPARPTSAPVVETPAPVQAPTIEVAPLVVIAPPAGPPPTAAQPQSTDPDAPVVTRPQPLD